MIRTSSCFAPLLLSLAAIPAQTAAEGLHTTSTSLPATVTHVLQLANGDVTFDGSDLVLAANGQAPVSLLHFAAPVFGSFLLPLGTAQVLFGENSSGWLYVVPLQGGAATPVAQVPFNYDADLLAPGVALVSARTGGWSSTVNDLVRVDLATGATQPLAQLPGASGPLAIAANGDAFYATASHLYPPPPAWVTILRFAATTIAQATQSATVLGPNDATAVATGIDAASDLCLDDDGDLLFADWMNQTVGELNDATSPQPWLGAPVLDFTGTGNSAASLQFVPGGQTVFEPFQPTGARLLVHASDYFTVNELVTVAASRPQLAVNVANPIATGPLQASLVAGPANGIAIVAVGFGSAGDDLMLAIPGFEAPLVWSSVLDTSPLLAIALDGQGQAGLGLANPGFATPQPAILQMATLAPNGALGSSQPLGIVLSQ